MKKTVSLYFLIALISQISYSQKEDKVWVLGYRYSDQPVSNGIYFYFDDSLTIEYKTKPISLKESNAMICDSTGKLLLLSNSCYIETGDGVMVENSNGLNPGWVYDNLCSWPSLSYPHDNNMILLQAPDSQAIYHLFHTRTYATIQPLVGFRDVLFHTKIDMLLNSGNGKVVFKNKPLVQDTLHPDGLHAVRHANGRDWWVATAKTHSNKYYLLLLTPDGITIKEQNVGETTSEEGGGEIVFSPDGRKMARFNPRDDLRIFDFDRCTGVLSNPVYIPEEDNADNELFGGLAFSADGRYLYASEVKRILQFDMLAADVGASKTVVAERVLSPDCSLGSSIIFLELAPDGRIYCRPGAGQWCMHRLARPELAGTAADFVQYYYKFDFSYDKASPTSPTSASAPSTALPATRWVSTTTRWRAGATTKPAAWVWISLPYPGTNPQNGSGISTIRPRARPTKARSATPRIPSPPPAPTRYA
jgi:hypothetical protein